MNRLLLVCCIQFSLVLAVYEHRPGERYQRFLPSLNPDQLAQVKQIIYDQSRTKGQTLDAMKEWVRQQPPTTQSHFIKSIFDYKSKDESRNRALDEMETMISQEARTLNQNIRKIYDDMGLSDRETCEAVSATIAGGGPSLQEELNITPMDCERVFAALAH